MLLEISYDLSMEVKGWLYLGY